jgi:DASH complex subunit DAD4
VASSLAAFTHGLQEKLNEAIVVMNKTLQVCQCLHKTIAATYCSQLTWYATLLQEINIQNMNIELVAQMFKNYQSNVLFHLEGERAGKH